MSDQKLPEHWIPVSLLGLSRHILKAAHAYAEEYARKALETPASAPEALTPAQHLLAEARKYWDTTKTTTHPGAVQWISDDESGALLIYTRGEYRETLMKGIYSINAGAPEALSDERIMALYDSEIYRGGSADSVIVRTVRAALAAPSTPKETK